MSLRAIPFVHTCIYVLPVKDGSNACTVSTVPVDMQAGGQQNPILHRDGAMGERCNQEFIPACWCWRCGECEYWQIFLDDPFIRWLKHTLLLPLSTAVKCLPSVPTLLSNTLTMDKKTLKLTLQTLRLWVYLHGARWPGRLGAVQRSEGSSWPTPPG